MVSNLMMVLENSLATLTAIKEGNNGRNCVDLKKSVYYDKENCFPIEGVKILQNILQNILCNYWLIF